jgi:pimeloyl-ACP methyl ester carboxylesterase
MTGRRRRLCGLGTLVVAALSTGPGCMCLNSKSIVLPTECMNECAEVPCACRGQVYVFLMSGIDPFDSDRVGDFRTALIRAGFTRVYSGQGYHDTYFAAEMHRLALAEPDSRFVLVGFSSGAEFAASLAESVGQNNLPITLLASIDAPWWSTAPEQRPANVQQVMHIHGEPFLFAGRISAGMDVQIPESFPNNITAHPLTVEQLARTLASIAGTVPRPEQPPPPTVVETTPTPRPTVRHLDGPRDAWDFLRPVASLRGLKPPDADLLPPAPVSERTTLRPAQP